MPLSSAKETGSPYLAAIMQVNPRQSKDLSFAACTIDYSANTQQQSVEEVLNGMAMVCELTLHATWITLAGRVQRPGVDN